jgi:hypothetical protein
MTGRGKSTLINGLGNLGPGKEPTYPGGRRRPSPVRASSQGDIVTTLCQNVDIELDDGTPITIIDTPGLGDPRPSTDGVDQDTKNIAQMVQHMKSDKVKYVNCFIIVLNGAEPRLDAGTRTMISLFSACFGPRFLSNSVVVFTKWCQDAVSQERRHEDAIEAGSPTMEDLRNEELDREFAADFNYTGIPLPKLFIDSKAKETRPVSSPRRKPRKPTPTR